MGTPVDRRTAALLLVLGLFVCSLGVILTPVYQSEAAFSESQYRAADGARSYAAAHDLGYPDNFVLSQWGDNRMYNYFVNGESRSYGYARNTYDRFLAGVDGQGWYERLRGRVGFVVLERGRDHAPDALYTRLLEDYGSRSERGPGLAHYRVIRASDAGNHVLVRLVPGATLTGTGPPSSEVTVSTSVELGDRTVDYERRVRTDGRGNFSVTVPYPGRYEVGDAAVDVSESAVENGSTIRVGNASAASVTPVTPTLRPDPSGPQSSWAGEVPGVADFQG